MLQLQSHDDVFEDEILVVQQIERSLSAASLEEYENNADLEGIVSRGGSQQVT